MSYVLATRRTNNVFTPLPMGAAARATPVGIDTRNGNRNLPPLCIGIAFTLVSTISYLSVYRVYLSIIEIWGSNDEE